MARGLLRLLLIFVNVYCLLWIAQVQYSAILCVLSHIICKTYEADTNFKLMSIIPTTYEVITIIRSISQTRNLLEDAWEVSGFGLRFVYISSLNIYLSTLLYLRGNTGRRFLRGQPQEGEPLVTEARSQRTLAISRPMSLPLGSGS